MERKTLPMYVTLQGTFQRSEEKPSYLLFKDPRGKVIFMVHEDNLFDKNGNYFANQD